MSPRPKPRPASRVIMSTTLRGGVGEVPTNVSQARLATLKIAAMDWDLAQLRAYAATIDHGSLEAAAGALHVTPSAVSQRLKALERAVGAVLLQRSRPVRPTEPGEEVLRLARQVE